MNLNRDGNFYKFLDRYWYTNTCVTNNLCHAVWAFVMATCILMLGGVFAGALLIGMVEVPVMLLLGSPVAGPFFVFGLGGYGIIFFLALILLVFYIQDLAKDHQFNKRHHIPDQPGAFKSGLLVVYNTITGIKGKFCPRINWK